MTQHRTVTLYRMKLADHECSYGLRARAMIEQSGHALDEHLLTSREEVEDFKSEHQVDTTPQAFVDGERIGGSDELEAWLERCPAEGEAG